MRACRWKACWLGGVIIACGSAVSAQPPAGRSQLEFVDCSSDEASRAESYGRALRLELGRQLDEGSVRRLRVEGACAGSTEVRLVLEDLDTHARIEEAIPLDDVPPHLAERTVALAASVLFEVSDELARHRAAAPPWSEPAPDPSVVEAVDRPAAGPPLVDPIGGSDGGLGASAESGSEGRRLAAPGRGALVPPPVRVGVRGALRGVLVGGLGVTYGGRMSLVFDALSLELGADAGVFRNGLAEVLVSVFFVGVGIRPLWHRDGIVEISLSLHVEGGVSRFGTSPLASGFLGAERLSPHLASSARGTVVVDVLGPLGLEIGVELGAQLGLEVDTLGVPLVRTQGGFLTALLGATVAL